MEISCSECKYRKRNKCDLKTDEAVKDMIEKNKELLYDITAANKPRFDDTENVEKNL